MSLPSKTDQVNAVAKFLDSDYQEGRSLKEIATSIVDGFHGALTKSLKPAPSTARLGMLFKTPIDSAVRRIVWIDWSLGACWIVSDRDHYGWLGPVENSFFELCEEFSPRKRIEVDGKNKMVEMTPEDIAEKWSNPEWRVGDILSQFQRTTTFEVMATAPQSVLMKDSVTGFLSVDTNSNLERYYRKEVKKEEW